MAGRLIAGILMTMAGSGVLWAQAGAPPGGVPQGGAQPRAGAAQRGAGPNRAQLEQRVRDRLGAVMKQRLGLTDQQLTKLQESNRRFEERRRALADQERDVRMSLRDEVIRGDTTRQSQVSALIDRMMKTQRDRVDLMEQEQKELAGFLTPMQRVKYFGAAEAVRGRMQQMRQQRGAGQQQNRMRPGMGQQPRGQGMGGRMMGPQGQGMMGAPGQGMMGPPGEGMTGPPQPDGPSPDGV